MNKLRYWISVGSREIVLQGDGANHEFEIEATEEEVKLLQKLFEGEEASDNKLVGRAKTPYETFSENDQEIKNLPFDEHLRKVYTLIHMLGVPKTKEHIEGMKILV